MTGASRKVWRLLTSARLATVVIALVGAWAVLGSFIPQGDPKSAAVTDWAAGYPGLAAPASALGLHKAFTAPVFLVLIVLLAVLTAACAWERTRVAITRSRLLRTAAQAESAEGRADFEIVCTPGSSPADVLATTAEALERLGIRPTRREADVIAVSPVWSVWGSAVFHWALVALMVVIALGSLARSSGQIGIAVGQTKPDTAESYGVLDEGPLHTFGGTPRSIRVDAFDVAYETGGVKRGATPTVTVLDADGEVVKTQPVYPNNTLKTGSLTIYPYDYGLSATIAMLDDSGAEVQRAVQLIDFSGSSEDGSVPVDVLVLRDAAGEPLYRMVISVPLDRHKGGGFVGRLPEDPRARVVILNAANEPVLDQTLHTDETVELPSGGTLKLLGVDYYARLQLVDDPSIPLLYAAAVVAMIGLGVATLVRQQVLVAWVAEEAGETTLRVRMRLWRALTTSRSEIESELRLALGPAEEGSAS